MQVGFTATPATLEAMIANPDLVIGMATQLKQLRAENEEKQRKIEADAPRVLFVSSESWRRFSNRMVSGIWDRTAFINGFAHITISAIRAITIICRLKRLWT